MANDTGERPPDQLHASRFAIVPQWLLEESGDVVKLYAILDRYANKDERLWPGQVELAERMGCSDRHVRKLLARLKEIGALEVIKRRYNGSTIHRLVKERPEQGFLTDRNAGAGLSGTGVPPNESHSTRAKEPSEAVASTPARKSKAKPAFTSEADQVARTEWERRKQKPVCGFPALRLRVQDALDAGYTPRQVASVLPSMFVFSRNAFDMALSGGRSPSPPPADHPAAPAGPVTIDPDPDYDYEKWMDEHDPKWREREARGVRT